MIKNRIFTRKKFISLCLAVVPLVAAEQLETGTALIPATAAVAAQGNLSNVPTDLLGGIAEYTEYSSSFAQVSKSTRTQSLLSSARSYAKALKGGIHVPDSDMVVLRTVADADKNYIRHVMLDCMRDNAKGNSINVPNAIPQFLLNSVIDMTPMVLDAIDAMPLNPHVAEHMKHSVGHYYEDPDNPWSEQTAASIQSKLDAMAREYKLLGDAVKEGADLTDVKYIVIPDVGATDAAITSRTAELDALFEANPNLTLVVAFADDVAEVESDFCYDEQSIDLSTLSTYVKKISFTGKRLISIRSQFFSDSHALTSVYFRGLSVLQTVGYYFFSGAKVLTSVDFRGLSALHTVGDDFFSDSHALTSVYFRGLSALQTVGDFFFSTTLLLTSVDFRGLSALQTVGDYFFSGARRLTTVDFRGLSALQIVGDYFFSASLALTTVDFRGLSALQTVGDDFFSGARRLTTVDFRGLSALQTVGYYFFSGAKVLTSVDFRGLSALHTVGDFFFSTTLLLTSVDFRGLSALHTVGRQFFYRAKALTSVDFSGLSALHNVGDGFLAGTPKSQTITCTAAIETLLKDKYAGKASPFW